MSFITNYSDSQTQQVSPAPSAANLQSEKENLEMRIKNLRPLIQKEPTQLLLSDKKAPAIHAMRKKLFFYYTKRVDQINQILSGGVTDTPMLPSPNAATYSKSSAPVADHQSDSDGTEVSKNDINLMRMWTIYLDTQKEVPKESIPFTS